MPTLVVGMKTRGIPLHAHGKRGHGTCFSIVYLEKMIGHEPTAVGY
jgi:hypothetical protein